MAEKSNIGVKVGVLTLGALLALGFSSETMAQKVSKSERVGQGLFELAVSEKGNAVYVAAAGSRTVPGGKIYKLDAKTLAVTDSIDLKDAPPYGVGINDKTQTLYTSNTRNKSVHAIDLKTNKVIATISNGKEKSHTREVFVDEVNNKVYVSDVGEGSSVWVIDGKTNKFSHLIEDTGKSTTGIAIDKKNQLLYVTNMGTNEIGVIDLKTNKLSKSFASGGKQPVNLIFDEKSDRLFVAHQGSSDVVVLKGSTGEILKTIAAGEGALGINFDPAQKRIYTANRRSGTVSVIDSETYELLATLETGSHPNTIVINKATGAAYVTNKAKMARRVQGEPAPATPPAPDLNGDTVSLILP